MNAEHVMLEVADEVGWGVEAQLCLLFDFIENRKLVGELAEFLKERAEWEKEGE